MADKIISIQSLLAGKPPQEQHVIIANTLERFICEILDTSEDEKLPHTTAFHDLGMDSITAVKLKTKIQESLGGNIEIVSTDIFNYPNIDLLAGYVEDKLGLSHTKKEADAEQVKPEEQIEQISMNDLVKRLQSKITGS